MNNQFTKNDRDEDIAQKLSQMAEQTHASTQFAAELEERLRAAPQSKRGWLAAFSAISPSLRWVALMVVLGLVLSWSIKALVPSPQPATDNTPALPGIETPTPGLPDQTATPALAEDGTYDWRGRTLYLAASLPDSPAEANVYIAQPEQPATIESVRALADRFGIQGEVYEGLRETNAPSSYMVTEGKESLVVRSDRYFEYMPDSTIVNAETRYSINNPNARAIIDEFMRSHGFDFPYTVEPSELYHGFYVQPLTPDGFPLHHEYFAQNGLLFRLNEEQIVSVSASLLKYDPAGTYAIKSAREAFQQVVASTDFNGMIEGIHSSGTTPQIWKREYPVEEPVTLYGWLAAVKSVEGQPPLVSIDGFPAKGNLAGIENLEGIKLVKASGRFTLEDDRKVFNVDAWELYSTDDHDSSGKDAFVGTLQKQGEDVTFTYEAGTLLMPDVPLEVPLPLENAYVYGVPVGEVFEWEGIEHVAPEERDGGGGSNGWGFYKLNLTGPAVAFPTSVSQPRQGDIVYIIQEGDTGLQIAAAHGTTPEKIFEANPGLDALTPGKRILIPAEGSGSGTLQYTVKEGDTLAKIAADFGTGADELMRFNILDSSEVSIGQTVFIPGAANSAGTAVQYPPDEFFQGLEGLFVVNIYEQSGEAQQVEYGLSLRTTPEQPYGWFVLEGDDLAALEQYHNRPVRIWGRVSHVREDGAVVVQVDRYEIPYPDLFFEILQGTQSNTTIDGQTYVLLTTYDGETLVQLTEVGGPDVYVFDGANTVYMEALRIPNETIGGYQAVRTLSAGASTQSEPVGVEMTADQPNRLEIMPESLGLPAATIEKVELVYYTPNSRYAIFPTGSDAEYIQPAWRFYGHYSDGSEFEILVQALKQEYLIPELAPFTRPG